MMPNIESRRRRLSDLQFEKSPTNASLWLHKYIREQKVDRQESNAKQELVNQVIQIETPSVYKDFFKNIWFDSFEKTKQSKANPIAVKAINISGRMIVGLGSESVLETSITLHRTYGVPYIPGSALKGLAASYAHRFMGDEWKKETNGNSIGKAHELMFGSQDSAGFIIFYDALYVPNSYQQDDSDLPLEKDIITPHHTEYYKDGKTAPADWDSPVPIPMLSAQGKYLLVISANSGDTEFDSKLIKLAVEILELAFRDEGIGAKTSSGYGRAVLEKFDIENDASQPEATGEEEAPSNQTLIQEVDQDDVDKRRLEGILQQLEEISTYKREDRKKLNDLKKRIKKIEDEESRQKGIDSYLLKKKSLGQDIDSYQNELNWFIENKTD